MILHEEFNTYNDLTTNRTNPNLTHIMALQQIELIQRHLNTDQGYQ